MSFTPSQSLLGAHPGIIHRYLLQPGLVAFEYAPLPPASPTIPQLNTLIFIGGLYDGLVTVPYVPSLASSLPLNWRLAQILLSSSYTQWGNSALDKDVVEISACVEYFRKLRGPGGKIVLIGHSTGSQDIIHYLVSPIVEGTERSRIDGGIMQSSVSDREALLMADDKKSYKRCVEAAQEFVAQGKIDDILPIALTNEQFPGVPITARRWLSLASPGPEHDGQDDYFSSDLPDERLRATFGKIGKSGVPILFLYGGSDQYVPAFVDKKALVGKWERFVREGGGYVDKGSGIVEGANHALAEVPKEVTEDLCKRVVGFLGRL